MMTSSYYVSCADCFEPVHIGEAALAHACRTPALNTAIVLRLTVHCLAGIRQSQVSYWLTHLPTCDGKPCNCHGITPGPRVKR